MTSALLIDDLGTAERSELDLDVRFTEGGSGAGEGRTWDTYSCYPPTEPGTSCFAC